MAETDEENTFVSLEDESTSKPAKKLVKPNKKKTENKLSDESILDAEVLDTTVVEQAGGQFDVQWPLIGMDCPDCSSKAQRALSHLQQVINPQISSTAGDIKLTVDLDRGNLSQINSLMKSLGHPPNLPLYRIAGVQSGAVAKRNQLQKKDVRKLFMRQPGILDVEINRDDEILLRLLPAPTENLRLMRDRALELITGRKPRYVESSTTRLRADQWRLFGGAIAVPILLVITIGDLLQWSPILLGLIAAYGVLIGGLQMFHEAIASLLSKQMGFQVLTSIAVIGASVLGMWKEALLVVILVAVAAHLESSALENARKSMQGGLDRIPKTARRIISKSPKLVNIKEITFTATPMTISPSESLLYHQHANKTEEHEVISLELLGLGELIEVRSGELIPADGKIIDGFGALDKAPLTGESAPVEVGPGDELSAGLILARGPLVMEVTAVGEATRLSGIIDAVHKFKEQKPKIQNQLEKFTAIWVPIVLFGAIVIYYLMFPNDWKKILLLWVVACPCALLLTAAMPHAAALSKASRMGAIVRGGDILERLSKVNHVLLDKTGTLTSGRPTIGSITIAKGRQRKAAIALAGGIEKRSSHPYAHAVLEYLETESITPSGVSSIVDIEAGIKGVFGGKEILFIRADLASKHNVSIPNEINLALNTAIKSGHGASILVKDNQAIALFTFINDDTRDGSKELIDNLIARGITVEIISGDNQPSVNNFAKNIGFSEELAVGSLSPEDKVQWVENRSKTHVTMMVGDGFNDSAALAVSDVGVAVGTGESVNLEAADIMFPSDQPKMLVDLYDLSTKMTRALNTNIYLSVSITFILVFAVINQWYDELWVGVLVHEASALAVILNGARLAGKDGMLSMLFATIKDLWSDTKQIFIQIRAHYLT